MKWELEGDGQEELHILDVARRMLDYVQDQIIDAIEARENTLCHWCGVTIDEGAEHCGAIRCRRRADHDRIAEARANL